tara:strand:+ start:10563 stop:10784 length:222 start_codon:yes stop_codon:yes gene_type:complete
MNEVTVFIYLVFFVGLFGATFAFMWKMMTSTLADMDKPIKKTRVPAPHPEMEGVRYGEELLVFTPEKEEEDAE